VTLANRYRPIASYTPGKVLPLQFAPAGLLVREAALIGLLSPLLGSGDAVILAAASRIWLTALEVLAAIFVIALPTVPEAP